MFMSVLNGFSLRRFRSLSILNFDGLYLANIGPDIVLPFDFILYFTGIGRVWRYQRGNQNPYISKKNRQHNHCVQTDPAKNVWTRAYLIPERNRTVRRQEEGKNSVYKFVFCMNLGEINASLTISCCQMKHFGYVIVY
jgi:hypothetical protein